jgi:hypothetical protein
MRRKTLIILVRNAILAFCVLLSACFVVLHFRSERKSDVVQFTSSYGWTYLSTYPGGVRIFSQPTATWEEWHLESYQCMTPPLGDPGGLRPDQSAGFGIGYGSYFTSMKHNAWSVTVPFWVLCLGAILPLPITLIATSIYRSFANRPKRGFDIHPGQTAA